MPVFPAVPRLKASILMSAALVAASFAVAAPAQAGSFGVTGVFGELGTGDTQFSEPAQIGVDSTDGRIYVLDFRARNTLAKTEGYLKIKKFEADGTPVASNQTATLFRYLATQQPYFASGMAVDGARDVLYVAAQALSADSAGNPAKILRVPLAAGGDVTPTEWTLDHGTPADTSDDLNSAGAIAVDPATGDVYVAAAPTSTQKQMLWQLRPSGDGSSATVVTTKDVSPADPNDPDSAGVESISDLAVFGTKLYLLGPEAGGAALARVMTLTTSLGATLDAPLRATAADKDRPFTALGGTGLGLAIDTSGAVLVVDGHDLTAGGTNNGGRGISRFTALSSLVPEKYWGNEEGSLPCQFSRASDLAFNPVTSEVLATDGRGGSLGNPTGIRRIQRFGAGGTDCGFNPAKADFSVSANPTIGADVTLTSLSTLPTSKPPFGGSFTAYRWDLDNDGAFDDATGPAVTRQFTRGAKTVGLQVEVTGGQTADVKKTFTVRGPAPTAAFSVTPASPQAGTPATFNGGASTAAGGATIATYRWDFDGNGTFDTPASTSPTASFTYLTAGRYRAKLEVVDSDGEKDLEEKTVTVSAAPQPPTPTPTTTTPTPTVTGQTSPPGDKAAPTGGVGGGTITPDAKGTFLLKLTCPASETSCTFVLEIKTAKAVATSKSKKKKKVLSVGKGKLTVPGGKSATLKIKLSRSNLAAVRKLKKVKVTIAGTVTDAAGNSGQVQQGATLKAPKRR